MHKPDLIKQVMASAGLSRAQADAAVSETFEQIALALSRGERVAVSGLGVFVTQQRAGRSQRNPATGETLWVAEHRAVRFRPAEALKRAVRER